MNDNWELLRNILPSASKTTNESEGHIGLKKYHPNKTKQNKMKPWLKGKVETDMKQANKKPPGKMKIYIKMEERQI